MPRHTREVTPRLDAYHFHERDPDGYDDLYESFEWEVPGTFNAATYLCDRWADYDPDRVAVYAEEPDGPREYTFGELREDANRLANYLDARGVGHGDRVAVNGTQKVENLLAHLAAWKVGAMSVPLSVLLGADGLRYRLDNSGAVAYVADALNADALRRVRDDLDALGTVLVVDGEPEGGERAFRSALEGQPTDFGTAGTDPDDGACMIYTSGTTGEPKGVLLPHRTQLGGLPGVLLGEYNMEIREDDVMRTPVEWSWIGSLHLGIFAALYYGLPIVAHAESQFDPGRELELIDRYGITVTGGPPTAFRMMLQAAEGYDLDSLRVLVLGGESVGMSLVERAEEVFENAVFHEVYGQTEALLFVSDCEALGVEHRPGKMGKPVPGHEVRIQDIDTGEPVGTGEVGEIALRYEGDPMPFLEYWRKPERTAEKVVDGWLRSEDLGEVDDDGYLSFHSRKDDVIISSGYKMGPTEIEESLASHGAVANAGVIGVPDDTRGEIPKAFVETAEGHDPDEALAEELQDHVRERLAQYQYPREIEFVDELPRTTTGKVRRFDLREREGLT